MNKGSRKWINFNFDATLDLESTKKVSVKQASIDTSSASAIHTVTPPNNQRSRTSYSNVIEKSKPKQVQDLAVHPKKIKDVQTWLEENVISSNGHTPILLLTGPTGSGKTATINVLCSKMNIKVVEWINPTDVETNFLQDQVRLFSDFFAQSKYGSLCEANNRRITFVEDFPNFVLYNSSEFGGILEKCSTCHVPIVFVCTEASSSKIDLSQTLFPQDVREKYNITNINFNPCSNTLLKAALKRAYSIVSSDDLFTNASADVIDAIICTSMGDIRCALNQFQFSVLKGVCEIPTTPSIKKACGGKRKRNEKSNSRSTIVNMSKDEMLGFFHGLGRVLNPKHIEVDKSLRVQCDFDKLIDQFSTQPSTFNGFLQENYLRYFGDLDDVQKAANVLSQAQAFLEKWTERGDILVYALWTSVLGLMVYNQHKVSKWNQIKAPQKIKLV